MDTKVSVIVPTYNTDPERLDQLVTSIRKQSMDPSDYEVIFVDDGSTTDVFSRLQRLTRRHANFRAAQIENSGWACRPRNVGVGMARGDYVLFMDHDDVLFPEGLEKSYDFGKKYDADVVNHKEIRTDGWAWSWGRFTKDSPTAHSRGIACLLPMTPHKLYRRSFLLEHDVTFDEGARMLWEDVYFNTRVWARGPKVAILARYPVYHWANTGENTSSTFGRDPVERWDQLDKLFEFFHSTLPAGDDRDYMVKHWYKSRVLGVISKGLPKKDRHRVELELARARALSERWVSPDIKAGLGSFDRVKQTVIEQGDVEAAKALSVAQADLGARSVASDIRWEGSSLRVDASTTLKHSDGDPLLLRRRGKVLERRLDPPLEAFFGADGLTFKDPASKVSYLLTLKARSTREIWGLPGSGTGSIRPISDQEVRLEGDIEGHVDVLSAASGQPLSGQVWEIGGRFTALGATFHSGVVVPDALDSPAAALIEGRVAVAYRNKSGMLSLDVGGKVKGIVEAATLERDLVAVDRTARSTRVVMPLTGIHVFGDTEIPGYVSLQPVVMKGESWRPLSEPAIRIDAHLRGDSKGSRIVACGEGIPPGYYRVSTNFLGREESTDLVLDTILPASRSFE